MVKIRVHGTPEEVEVRWRFYALNLKFGLRVIGEDRFTKAVVICYNDNRQRIIRMLTEYAKSPGAGTPGLL